MQDKKWKNKNFLQALKQSLNGIKYTFKTERNLKIQLMFSIFAILLAIYLKISYIEWSVLFITIGLVITAELFNTAIETILDLYSTEYNEKIKIAKDIASGAVLITAIMSIMIGIVIFLPKIIEKIS